MAERSVCSVNGCNKPTYRAKSLCQGHWRRLDRHGDVAADVPLGGIVRRRKDVDWLEAHRGWQDDKCLIWPFKRSWQGYPQIQNDAGGSAVASRVMCRMVHGDPPDESHHAAHSCGNGRLGCVNPRHLRWADRFENYADRRAHGTDDVGERNPRAKLTEGHVREIRAAAASISNAEMARKYGVAVQTVSLARRRVNWRHLK